MNTMDMLFKQVAQSAPKQSNNHVSQISHQQSDAFKQTLAKSSTQPLTNDQRVMAEEMSRNESGLNIRAVVQQLIRQSDGNGLGSLILNAEPIELTEADVKAMLSKLGELSDEIKTLLKDLGIK